MKELLKKLFLFDNIDFEYLDLKYGISEKASLLTFEDGGQILPSELKGIYTVIGGKAKIVSVSKKREAPLRYLSEGDTFGAASLYGSDITHRTTVTSHSGTSVLVLPVELITDLIEKESAVAMNYVGFLSDRVAFLNRKIAAFSAGSADEKLALFLLSLPFEKGAYSLERSYTEVAKSLDVGRASLYRSIESFEKSGIIHRDGKIIYLDDEKKLYEMIN